MLVQKTLLGSNMVYNQLITSLGHLVTGKAQHVLNVLWRNTFLYRNQLPVDYIENTAKFTLLSLIIMVLTFQTRKLVREMEFNCWHLQLHHLIYSDCILSTVSSFMEYFSHKQGLEWMRRSIVDTWLVGKPCFMIHVSVIYHLLGKLLLFCGIVDTVV